MAIAIAAQPAGEPHVRRVYGEPGVVIAIPLRAVLITVTPSALDAVAWRIRVPRS